MEGVLAIDPTNPFALNSLGVGALDSGAFAEAESLFCRAATSDPKAQAKCRARRYCTLPFIPNPLAKI